MNDDQQIIDKSNLRKWRTEIPNLYDDADLDTYEFRLLVHYVRVGTCWQGTRTTAKICHMSVGQVSKKRQSLDRKGYITVTENEHGTYTIEVVDKWAENFSTYSAGRSPHEHGSVHHVNAKCSPHETKKEPIKKEHSTSKEKASLPAGEKALPTDTPSLKKKGSSINGQYVMMCAVGEVCKMDIKLNDGRVGKCAKGLIAAGYTIEQLQRAYGGDNAWWYKNDWRGKKNDPPKPEQINETIKQAVDDNKHSGPTSNGGRIPSA